jgi:hypothetical protein
MAAKRGIPRVLDSLNKVFSENRKAKLFAALCSALANRVSRSQYLIGSRGFRHRLWAMGYRYMIDLLVGSGLRRLAAAVSKLTRTIAVHSTVDDLNVYPDSEN